MFNKNNIKTFIAIDFETADYKADSACSVGMVRIEDMKIVDTFTALIKPPRKEFIFTYIHGLTWEDVEYAEPFGAVWHSATSFLKNADAFIAHNAPFDRKVLLECSMQHRIPLTTLPFFCTLKASRKFLRLPSYKLSSVAEHYEIPLKHHDAFSDASAAGQIFIELQKAGYNVWESLCPQKKK